MTLFEGTEIMKKTAAGVKAQRLIDDGEQWLADLVAKAKASPTGVITEVCALTPSRATALLARNTENRKINTLMISRYASDIMANRWAFNGETIKISSTGELNDGQHRCLAVVECGHSMETLLVCGVKRKTRFSNDMGVPRTIGSFIHMHGVKYANQVSTIAHQLVIIDGGQKISKTAASGTTQNRRPSKSEVLEYAKRHEEEILRAIEVVGVVKNGLPSAARLAFALVLISRAIRAWEPVAAYIRGIIDGADLSKGSPQYAVRARLIADRGELNLHQVTELIIRGWNAYRGGIDPMPKLKVIGNWPTIAR